jgi:O-antigen/teichoic acid export membrane protein
VLWLFIGTLGIMGAALAWFLRVTADAAVLFVMAHRRIGHGSTGARTALVAGGGGALLIAVGALLPGLAWRGAYAAALLAIFGVVVWHGVVVPGHRILSEARASRTSQ